MAKLFGSAGAVAVVDATTLQFTTNFGFYLNGTVTDNTVNLNVILPGTISVLLLNQAIADALVSYVNSTYGTSFVRVDVELSGGYIPLVL